jgi:hypothetical protein
VSTKSPGGSWITTKEITESAQMVRSARSDRRIMKVNMWRQVYHGLLPPLSSKFPYCQPVNIMYNIAP